jgi:hypothetical protein
MIAVVALIVALLVRFLIVTEVSGAMSALDEDADVRSHLVALGVPALAELRRVLEGPETYPTAVLRALTSRPGSAELATLIAMADTDEVVRLRLLRAIRDLGV